MVKHDDFLKNAAPSVSRVGNHRLLCCSAQGENCSCNGGSNTYSDLADPDPQLLKPGNADSTRNIRNIKPKTSTGLDNFRCFCHTNNALEA